MSLFTPVGEKSYVDQLWEWLLAKPVGTVLAYSDQSLPFPLETHRHAVGTVAKRMERVQQRTLRPVRGIGYEIVRGTDQTDLARRDLKTGQRKARRANLRASTVDVAEMSGAEQMDLHQLQIRAQAFAQMADVTSRRVTPSS